MSLKYVALLTLAMYLLATVDTFSVEKRSKLSCQRRCQNHENASTLVASDHDTKPFATTTTTSGLSAMMMAILLQQPGLAMATTEVELAELPPPWIPVVFGIGLIVV